MPVRPEVSYPGVYIQEVPSGVRTIVGVATSITAFIGRAWRGPLNEPMSINSFADYDRVFGGLWHSSTMSYAVQQFFQNGGRKAVCIRVAKNATEISLDLGGGTSLRANGEGTWGRNLKVTVNHDVKPGDNTLFNLIVEDRQTDDDGHPRDTENRGGSGEREIFRNISVDETHPRYLAKVLEEQSFLVRARTDEIGSSRPRAGDYESSGAAGSDGVEISDSEILGGDRGEKKKEGIYALEDIDLFNLLCIPPLTPGEDGTDIDPKTWDKACSYCKVRRAIVIVDAPVGWKLDTIKQSLSDKFAFADRENAAIYFPRIKITNLQQRTTELFAPCGVIAGLISRTDSTRGVWKAPAGIEATLRGVSGLNVLMTDDENGDLNKLGVNCLRIFTGIGRICWGARTMAGEDRLASEWKYLSIRRLALYLEESLYRGLKWVVFEPNDEPLWAQIRLNVGAFMHDLFRQGAFEGRTPKEAYFVKCDSETTTSNDRNLGIVNIWVGFAPLKPAEFVILYLQQKTAEAEG